MNKIIPLIFLTDNNYVIPTVVAIQSIIDNVNLNVTLDVNIIARNVDEDNKDLLRKLAEGNVIINIIDIKDDYLNKFEEEGYYVSGTALLKFNIGELFPNYDKVLYLDGDIIVRGDISELFDIDVNDYYLAGIPDMAAMEACHFEEHLDIDYYFNSGVMLINTKKFRENKLMEKLYEVKKKNPDYKCMDQDVFNDVCCGHVLFLQQKYNLMLYNFKLAKFSLEQVNNFYDSEYDSFDSMDKEALIWHLTNERKPWKYQDGYKAKEWLNYFNKSPLAKSNVKLPFVEKKQSMITRYGPFEKKWSPSVTTLSILGGELIKKNKGDTETSYEILGIKIIKKRKEGFYESVYIGKVLIQRKIDELYFLHRLDTYKSLVAVPLMNFANDINVRIEDFGNNKIGTIEDQLDLFRQLQGLESLCCHSKKEENYQ